MKSLRDLIQKFKTRFPMPLTCRKCGHSPLEFHGVNGSGVNMYNCPKCRDKTSIRN